MKAIQAGNKGKSNVVHQLRREKLRKGLPFMIYTSNLASGQCYYEHPGGSIDLVEISSSKDVSVLRTLSPSEAESLRRGLHLA